MIKLKPQLHKFSIHGAHGADSLRAALAPYFGDQILELERGSREFAAQFSLLRGESIRIYHGSYEQSFRLQLRDSRCFIQGFPTRGAGECVNNGTVMASSPRKGILTEPGCIDLSYGPGLEHLSIFIDPDALAKALTALVGMSAARQLKLDMNGYELRPEARMLRRLVNLLMMELAAEDSLASPLLTAELEQAILVAFLCGNGHNYSHLLDGRPRRCPLAGSSRRGIYRGELGSADNNRGAGGCGERERSQHFPFIQGASRFLTDEIRQAGAS